MRIDKDPAKEELNRRNHGFDFSFAEIILGDPLATMVYDRFENGEHRWHVFARVGNTVLLIVVTYPDPSDESWIRVIGLRKATSRERKCYEEERDND
jgi:uncharacterized DUF497 family protein